MKITVLFLISIFLANIYAYDISNVQNYENLRRILKRKNGHTTENLLSEEPSDKNFDPSISFPVDNNTSFKIKNKFWRKQLYFTQGLSFIDQATLLESSGLNGESVFQKIIINDVQIQVKKKLDSTYFGEGSDIIKTTDGTRAFLLTWKQKKVFIYNYNLQLEKTIDLPKGISEGWGLTHFRDESGKQLLILSDGSYFLYHIDPATFSVIKKVPVYYDNNKNNKMVKLNELENYKGVILANIWLTNTIVSIDPLTGKHLAQYDFTELTRNMEETPKYQGYSEFYNDYCLNGIAYHEESDTLILTGKKWPWLYQIQLDINN